jgi:hypothetical protein
LPDQSNATIVSRVDTDKLTPRRPRSADVAAIIGLLAKLEGELMLRNDRDYDVPEWARRFATRLSRDGLLAPEAGNRDLRQTLNDLNHRLRYVLGEYDEPPKPMPVP